MRLERIDALFAFIDFLHENIIEFKKYNSDIENFDEIFITNEPEHTSSNIFEERRINKERKHRKLKHWSIIEENILQLIKNKAREVNLMDVHDSFNWTGIRQEIEEIPERSEYESEYSSTRKKYIEIIDSEKFMKYLPFFSHHFFNCMDSLFLVEKEKNSTKDNPESKTNGEQKEPIYPETGLNVEFNPQIFKTEYASRLFCYLIHRYHNGKDVELSNIYQWMENKRLIHQNKRQEYKAFVKKHKITENKYSRVHPSTDYNSNKSDPTFNDLQKKFDNEIKR